jgi:hypothetical protein
VERTLLSAAFDFGFGFDFGFDLDFAFRTSVYSFCHSDRSRSAATAREESAICRGRHGSTALQQPAPSEAEWAA